MMQRNNMTKQYIVASMTSSKESAIELAKRLANKENKVFFVGEVCDDLEFHPVEKQTTKKKENSFTEGLEL